MANPTAPRRNVPKAEWLHWLFVRDNQTLSCEIAIEGDGSYTVTLSPLSPAGDQITETFSRPAEAVRWHANMTRRLQASGWLLVEGGPVTNAA